MTSSLGRLLDACAALVNICNVRTYRGEPAMRLEGFTWNQLPLPNTEMTQYIEDTLILGDKLLFDYARKMYISQNKGSIDSIAQLARSFTEDIARLFAFYAIQKAQEKQIGYIGVSGGVAHNEIIMRAIKSEVEKANLIFLQHQNVPPGDAGISLGQIAVAAARNL